VPPLLTGARQRGKNSDPRGIMVLGHVYNICLLATGFR